ncbi:MAG: RNA polymerase sigma factor [Planctomycetes bacterium]|nr:RNA polymerase sigma factor [Planctomycetota bacterium]
MNETDLRNSLTALHSASFAWAMTCCRDRELAEDVLQSVYVKVLGGDASYGQRSSFRTWLFAVIRNAARDQRRRQWWSRVVRLEFELLSELADSYQGDESGFDDRDELLVVRSALGNLPERQRQVTHLVFYEELTVAEAAKVMSVTVGTARQHYARAKEALRVSLRPLWSETNESIVR